MTIVGAEVLASPRNPRSRTSCRNPAVRRSSAGTLPTEATSASEASPGRSIRVTASSAPSTNCSVGRSGTIIIRLSKSASTRPIPTTVQAPWVVRQRRPCRRRRRRAARRAARTATPHRRRAVVRRAVVIVRDGVFSPGSSMATSRSTEPSPATIGAQSLPTTAETSAPSGMPALSDTASSKGWATTMSVPERAVQLRAGVAGAHEGAAGDHARTPARRRAGPPGAVRPGRRRTSRRASRAARRHCVVLTRYDPASSAARVRHRPRRLVDDPPVAEEDDPVGLRREARLVGDEHDGRAEPARAARRAAR